MPHLLPTAKQAFFDGSGKPLVGGRLYTYATGTNTPSATWKDPSRNARNTNPVVLDARGEATIFWHGVYKVALHDADDVLLWAVDGVGSDNGSGEDGEKGDPGGNVLSIGLFTQATGLNIGGGTDLVQTSGYAKVGVGAALYYADHAVDAAYVTANPRTSFVSQDGRGFRLLVQNSVNAQAFGAMGDGARDPSTGKVSGTDDTAAVQAVLDYIGARKGGTAFFPDGIYVIAGPIKGTANAQLSLPAVTDPSLGFAITLEGKTAPQISAWNEAGAILYSTLAGGDGQMIGCDPGGGATARVAVYLTNLTVRTVPNPTISAINMSAVAMFKFTNVQVTVDAPPPSSNDINHNAGTGECPLPTTEASYGIIGSRNNVPTYNIYDNVQVGGFRNGLLMGELTGIVNMVIGACYRPVVIPELYHPNWIGRLLITNSPSGITVRGGAELYCDLLDIEHDAADEQGPSWVEPNFGDIIDPGNLLKGRINAHCHDDEGGYAGDSKLPFTVVGARNVEIFNPRYFANRSPFYPIFSGFSPNAVTATGAREIRETIADTPSWHSMVAVSANGQALLASMSASNTAVPRDDKRVAQFTVVNGDTLGEGGAFMEVYNTLKGMMERQFGVGSHGNVGFAGGGDQHFTQGVANSDIAGLLAIGGTSATFNFNRAFDSVPIVTATPQFDVGAGVRVWVVPSKIGFTINASATIRGAFSYSVLANPS